METGILVVQRLPQAWLVRISIPEFSELLQVCPLQLCDMRVKKMAFGYRDDEYFPVGIAVAFPGNLR